MANISQQYKREVTDWIWLCVPCHMKQDGRTGRKRPGTGKPMTPERKQAMSDRLKGRKQTPEHIAKRRHLWTDKQRQKMLSMIEQRQRDSKGRWIKKPE